MPFPFCCWGGCDKIYGVESSIKLEGPIDVPCINAALSSVPEVGRVTFESDKTSTIELLPKQRKRHTASHVWTYGKSGGSILQIIRTSDGWDFKNARRQMGEPIDGEEAARFVRLMRLVNATIQKRCGLAVGNLTAQQI